jgi:hypothetical protein
MREEGCHRQEERRDAQSVRYKKQHLSPTQTLGLIRQSLTPVPTYLSVTSFRLLPILPTSQPLVCCHPSTLVATHLRLESFGSTYESPKHQKTTEREHRYIHLSIRPIYSTPRLPDTKLLAQPTPENTSPPRLLCWSHWHETYLTSTPTPTLRTTHLST